LEKLIIVIPFPFSFFHPGTPESRSTRSRAADGTGHPATQAAVSPVDFPACRRCASTSVTWAQYRINKRAILCCRSPTILKEMALMLIAPTGSLSALKMAEPIAVMPGVALLATMAQPWTRDSRMA
jgi:hypothetical protein